MGIGWGACIDRFTAFSLGQELSGPRKTALAPWFSIQCSSSLIGTRTQRPVLNTGSSPEASILYMVARLREGRCATSSALSSSFPDGLVSLDHVAFPIHIDTF